MKLKLRIENRTKEKKNKLVLVDPRLRGIEISKDLTLEEIQIRGNNLYNGKKGGHMIVVINPTHVLVDLVGTSVMVIQK